MLDEGNYKAVAVSTGLGVSGTGTEQIGIMFRTSEGVAVGYRGYFTEKTTERTIQSLRNCGWNGNDLSVFTETNEAECVKLLPNEVEIVVEHKPPMTPEGRTYAEVKWVNKIGSGVVTMKDKLDANRARAFAERMKGACLAVPAQSGGAPRPPAQPARNEQRRPAPPVSRDEPPPGFFDDNDDFPR